MTTQVLPITILQPPRYRDTVVWVRWEDRFGFGFDPLRLNSSTDAREEWVRGTVTGDDLANETEQRIIVHVGTDQEVGVWRELSIQPLDVVDTIAHADGVCPYCLDTMRLISRHHTIDKLCVVCARNAMTEVSTPRYRIIYNGKTYTNGSTTVAGVTSTWELTTFVMPDVGRQSPTTPPVKKGFRSKPGLVRRRPGVSRAEAAWRRRLSGAHGRRPT